MKTVIILIMLLSSIIVQADIAYKCHSDMTINMETGAIKSNNEDLTFLVSNEGTDLYLMNSKNMFMLSYLKSNITKNGTPYKMYSNSNASLIVATYDKFNKGVYVYLQQKGKDGLKAVFTDCKIID